MTKLKSMAFCSLSLLFVVLFPVVAMATDVISVTRYIDSDFTWRSAPEYVNVGADCDSISVHAECEGDEIDNLTVYIEGYTYPDYCYTYTFPADGSVTTYPLSLPSGIYKVYFLGSADIVKTRALLVFSVVEN